LTVIFMLKIFCVIKQSLVFKYILVCRFFVKPLNRITAQSLCYRFLLLRWIEVKSLYSIKCNIVANKCLFICRCNIVALYL